MTKKLPVSELLRRACIYAEQDQSALIDAYHGDESQEVVKEAMEFLKQLREYRLKRWGKTRLEQQFEECESVDVFELMRKMK